MFKKGKMELLSVAFIIIGTAIGGYSSWKNKKETDILEEANSDLLIKNVRLTEELKNTSDENLELSKKFERYIEEMKYFNNADFSYLTDIAFPEGFTVFRQNKSFKNFKKAYGEKLFFMDFDLEIIETSPGEFSTVMENARILPHQKNSISMIGGTATRDKFRPKNFKTLQVINELPLVENMLLAVLMINDGHEYTFAVGFTPRDRELYLKNHN